MYNPYSRVRDRGPLKSWHPQSMASAITEVLKHGLSLSQAARKYDIPYPTFVLYANRVNTRLGPSEPDDSDSRPKGRGRPQRILLGHWNDELIEKAIDSVVFRNGKPFNQVRNQNINSLESNLTISCLFSNRRTTKVMP